MNGKIQRSSHRCEMTDAFELGEYYELTLFRCHVLFLNSFRKQLKLEFSNFQIANIPKDFTINFNQLYIHFLLHAILEIQSLVFTIFF